MSASGTSAPAGWYPDPEYAGQARYWDGAVWTDLRRPVGGPYAAPLPLTAPPGTEVSTVWLWLIMIIQFVPLVFVLLVPWGSFYDINPRDPYAGSEAALAVFLSPWYWLTVVGGWAAYALTVFFAYRDVKELAARGVPRPFHWAFAFIGAIVYVIGRAVVAHRRTGTGRGPIWVEALYIAVNVAVVVIIMMQVFQGLSSLFGRLS